MNDMAKIQMFLELPPSNMERRYAFTLHINERKCDYSYICKFYYLETMEDLSMAISTMINSYKINYKQWQTAIRLPDNSILIEAENITAESGCSKVTFNTL
jgi:hypothetical protein